MKKRTLEEELKRYHSINRYGSKMIMEQADLPDADLPNPEGDEEEDPLAGDDQDPMDDVDQDALAGGDEDALAGGDEDALAGGDEDALAGGDEMGDETEEIDITDLVNMTKSIKRELENKKSEDNIETYMDDVFKRLDDLELKLNQMDMVFNKIDDISSKIDKIKEPTQQERLEMRSLDSYPFNQTPNKFFDQKKNEMEQSGKNEYVLTKQELSDYSNDQIRSSFNPNVEEDDFKY